MSSVAMQVILHFDILPFHGNPHRPARKITGHISMGGTCSTRDQVELHAEF